MSSYDNDLNPILEKATNEELLPIVTILTGKYSNSIKNDERYKRNPENPLAFVGLIATEIRKTGSNSWANNLLGQCDSYNAIVRTVGDNWKVHYSEDADIALIECGIIQKIFETVLETVSDNERAEIVSDLILDTDVYDIPNISPQVLFGTENVHQKITQLIVDAIYKKRDEDVAKNLFSSALRFFIQPFALLSKDTYTTALNCFITTRCVLHVAHIRQRLILEGILESAQNSL